MNLTPKNTTQLTQHSAQRLKLTLQMRQSLKILQLSAIDLKDYLENESAANPLLDEERWDIKKLSLRKKEMNPDILDSLLDHETADYDENSFGNDSLQKKQNLVEDPITREVSLEARLLRQLNLLDLTSQKTHIGREIIGNINEDGYLVCGVAEIAKSCKAKVKEVKIVLNLIQGFEPAGIAARNLEECLLIQLDRNRVKHGFSGSLAVKIVKNHFQDLASKKYVEISKKLKVSIKKVIEAVDQIRRLDPKPTRNFSVSKPFTVIPDIVIHCSRDGYHIDSCSKELPRFRISFFYRTLLRAKNTSQVTKEYLKEKLNSGLGLIRAVERRGKTLERIANFIVKEQKEFLDYGLSHLKPMTLDKAARELGFHKSTLSRAANGKYIETPHGTFELKTLFNQGLPRDGKIYSSAAIKVKIQNILQEQLMVSLSDKKITDILTSEGISIARRTVTKYRQQLRILPSYFRK